MPTCLKVNSGCSLLEGDTAPDEVSVNWGKHFIASGYNIYCTQTCTIKNNNTGAQKYFFKQAPLTCNCVYLPISFDFSCLRRTVTNTPTRDYMYMHCADLYANLYCAELYMVPNYQNKPPNFGVVSSLALGIQAGSSKATIHKYKYVFFLNSASQSNEFLYEA